MCVWKLLIGFHGAVFLLSKVVVEGKQGHAACRTLAAKKILTFVAVEVYRVNKTGPV